MCSDVAHKLTAEREAKLERAKGRIEGLREAAELCIDKAKRLESVPATALALLLIGQQLSAQGRKELAEFEKMLAEVE